MTYFRHAAIVAALVAGATTASAQTTVITREPVESRTVVTTEPLQLTPVQRRTIYRTIVRERSCRLSRRLNIASVRACPTVYGSIRFRERSRSKCRQIRSYKYMVVNDRVVLVDPATSEVVAELAD